MGESFTIHASYIPSMSSCHWALDPSCWQMLSFLLPFEHVLSLSFKINWGHWQSSFSWETSLHQGVHGRGYEVHKKKNLLGMCRGTKICYIMWNNRVLKPNSGTTNMLCCLQDTFGQCPRHPGATKQYVIRLFTSQLRSLGPICNHSYPNPDIS